MMCSERQSVDIPLLKVESCVCHRSNCLCVWQNTLKGYIQSYSFYDVADYSAPPETSTINLPGNVIRWFHSYEYCEI